MTFKLIREAQATARLGDKAADARAIQQILGADSITAVEEAFNQKDFEVTPAHYNQWLSTLLDIAKERGVGVNTRNSFNDIAFEILDNDSFVDALGGDLEQTKTNIVKALWQAHRVNQAHHRVQNHVSDTIEKAKEDEQLAAALAGSDQRSGFEQAFDAAKGVEQEESTPVRRTREPVFHAAVRKNAAKNPYPAGSLRAALWDETRKNGVEDEELLPPEELPPEEVAQRQDVDTSVMTPDDLAAHITGDSENEPVDVEARVDDLEARVSDIEAGATGDDDGVDVSQLPPADKVYDEEEQVKKLFRQAITAPKTHLSSALKDIEKEGEKAWSSLSLPPNPHLKKSPAYKAWEKGMKTAARAALGLVDKPTSTSKQTKKRN